jgi:LysM repeat protein
MSSSAAFGRQAGEKQVNEGKMRTSVVVLAGVAAMAAGGAFAQSASRDAFLKQQAVAEMQRVSSQVDVLAANQEELADRVRKAESMKGEIDSLRAEVAALKGTIAELRRELQGQRGEIVQDLSKKIASMQTQLKAPPKQKQVYSGPCCEYTVVAGDTLSLIAKAFDTTVQKIKDMNGMTSDVLRVGQKINVPKVQ